MADRASSSITVNAPPAEVMAVIADFAAYPDWAGFMKEVTIVDAGSGGRANAVHFRLDAGVIKADYTLAYTWDGDRSVSWTMQSGTLKEMSGSYTLAPEGDATVVTYALSVELGVPMLGMFKRKAEKVVMDTALKELKKRVEA